LNLNFEHSLAALNPVSAVQESFRDFLSVYEGSVSRTEVTQETARRGNLEQAMMAGKETILGEIKVRALAAADQKSVMLVEDKLASGVGAGHDS
jgi:hypothetical protein